MSPQMVSDSTREDLASAYRKASGPFAITMDDHPDLIVMSSADIDLKEAPLTEAKSSILLTGYAAAQRGETVRARDAIQELRFRYEL